MTARGGFEPMERGGPFFALLGPVHARRDAAGLLATLCDAALGINIAMARRPLPPMVTVNLSTDYLEVARPGDWLEAHVHMRKAGRRLAFAECLLQVGDRVVARATGVFSAVGSEATKAPAGEVPG